MTTNPLQLAREVLDLDEKATRGTMEIVADEAGDCYVVLESRDESEARRLAGLWLHGDDDQRDTTSMPKADAEYIVHTRTSAPVLARAVIDLQQTLRTVLVYSYHDDDCEEEESPDHDCECGFADRYRAARALLARLEGR